MLEVSFSSKGAFFRVGRVVFVFHFFLVVSSSSPVIFPDDHGSPISNDEHFVEDVFFLGCASCPLVQKGVVAGLPQKPKFTSASPFSPFSIHLTERGRVCVCFRNSFPPPSR